MKKEIKKPTFHPDVVEEMRIFEELLKKEGISQFLKVQNSKVNLQNQLKPISIYFQTT